MELFEMIINFFGIDMLTSTSTLTDLLNLCISIFVAMFLVCFTVRSLFLLLKFGDR